MYKKQLNKIEESYVQSVEPSSRTYADLYPIKYGMSPEDERIKDEVSLMKARELLDVTKQMSNDQTDNNLRIEAMNALPNLEPLREIAFYKMCSAELRQRIYIRNRFDIATLLSIAMKSKWFNIDDTTACATNPFDQKERLIDVIVNDDELLAILYGWETN